MDTINGDLSVTGGTGSVTGGVLGGNGKDDIGVSLTGDGLASLGTLDVSVDGGHGKDNITTIGDVTVVDDAHH